MLHNWSSKISVVLNVGPLVYSYLLLILRFGRVPNKSQRTPWHSVKTMAIWDCFAVCKNINQLGKREKKTPWRFSVQTHSPEGFWESRKQATDSAVSRDPQQQQSSNQQHTIRHPLDETWATTSLVIPLHSLTAPWPFSQQHLVSFTWLQVLLNN